MRPPGLQTLKRKHLWRHQARAVAMLERYLAAYDGEGTSGSALVRLPTGTGKTGVIAVAGRLLAPPGLVVVACPSVALREQLCAEVSDRFWQDKLGIGVPEPDLPVGTFIPSTLSHHLDGMLAYGSGILIGTAQSLAKLHQAMPRVFGRLAKNTALLLFDEGHREPARRWGEAARALTCPRVLFSATPYRNDYALFDIDRRFVESFSFHDALAYKCIRDVEVCELDVSELSDLVDAIARALRRHGPHSRAIVRCATKSDIQEVVTAVTQKGHECIGIHDRFRDTDGQRLRSSVPKPDSVAARIWVHQNKLLEGIDDPRFSIVAVHGGFGNARSLVQQVGRVIRNPGRKKSRPALLLVSDGDGQREYWNRYLDFERAFEPTRHDVRDLIQEAVSSQPAFRYLDGNYREIFDPFHPSFFRRPRFPRSANIYTLSDGWHARKVCEEMIAEWEQGDRVVLNFALPTDETIVILYADARNSPILLRDYFIEDMLGFTVVHRLKDWLFYHDTRGLLSEAVRAIADPLPPTRMHVLFGRDTRAVAVSMRNTDVGRHAFRRRTVHAYSLADASTGVSDHSYFCSTAEGYVGRRQRRYVGIVRSRLRESSPSNHNMNDFLSWVRQKAEALDGRNITPELFRRYAAPVNPPADPTPRHLLLDLSDMLDRAAYRTIDGGEEMVIEDLAVPVKKGRCTIVANEVPYELCVRYDASRERYRLESKTLDDAYVLADTADRFRRGVIAHLNVEQAFRVVPTAGWTIYAHGHFVKPTTGLGGSRKDGPELLRLITQVPALGRTASEKGGPGSATEQLGWAANSVFGLIDRARPGRTCPKGASKLRKAMNGLDTVVCDDMHREVADFICGDTTQNRIVVIHGKWNDSKRSASAFHDVCSQAVKNLDLLQPFAIVEPPNLNLWDSNWSAYADKKAIGHVRRIRVGASDGAECWNNLSRLLRLPDTEREVWLVLGRTIDLAWLKDEQHKMKPQPAAVQLFYLLQSTWAAVCAVGARLRIFAS